ncbi:MAG: Type-1 restriction enzyme EcoKI specificity protein [Elusimicrobia bacterium ADurb.Bin231]|nr:MAG: Type-1 restriction enzyme EcoKI specificity protein [Elusimicrobia bacterium ADurb.Bin231]
MTKTNKLPTDWRWAKLGEVCEINPSKPKNFNRLFNAQTTFIPMVAVDGQTGTIKGTAAVPYSKVYKGYTYFEENDVLFAKITPCMQNGKHIIARNLIDGLGFGTTEFHVLRPQKEVLPEWIYYFIRQKHFLYEAISSFTGAVGQQRVPASFLSNYVLPLPPLKEQQRIAKKIQDLLAKVEKTRTACEKQLEAAQSLMPAYLHEVFESKEAKKWEKKKLGDSRFFTILPSGVDHFNNTKEYLSTNSIQKDKITHIEETITYDKRPSRANMQPQLNSVWFAKMKNTIKVYSFTKDNKEEIEKFILSTGFAGILCKDGVSPEYLKQIFLNYAEFNKMKDTLTSGATQQAVNNENIKSISVLFPSLPKQKSIATELKEKMSDIEKLQSEIRNQQSVLNALPQAILKQAFRGQL